MVPMGLDLRPQDGDASAVAQGAAWQQAMVQPLALLVGRPLAALVGPRCRQVATVPQWVPACRAQLLSAATGGQWPQVRVAKIPHATADTRCQL